jgi:pyruvate dehydrogenase E1 component alpha subunit
MYERMMLIRRMEEQLGEDFKAGKLPGPVHLYIGQEAVAVGLCAHLNNADWIASTHRGHGHFLAKGGSPDHLMAEVYGRVGGICKGMAGSMHVADFSKGIIGANGIVGGGIALTVGAALAAQMDGHGAVAVAFFGDGASNQGVLMEALNLGALWKLPLILVCENNGFSEFSPTISVTAGEIRARAEPFGIPGISVDGNNVHDVWRVANEAVGRARRGEGPTLIEARTYRLRGHVEAEVQFLTEDYRDDSEVSVWLHRDPITQLGDRLIAAGVSNQAKLQAARDRVEETVRAAVAYADASPLPDPAQMDYFMFKNQLP